MGQDSNYPEPGVGMPYNISLPHEIVNALTPEAKPVLFEGAVQGHVLVKNVNNTLPLKSPKLISVFGYDAVAPSQYMPNNRLYTDPWDMGFDPVLNQIEILENQFTIVNYTINEPYDYQVAYNGTLITGGGSGANNGPYISAPLDALQQRAYDDNTVVMWDTTVSSSPNNLGMMQASDVCLVFINAFASEGIDRAGTYDSYSDNLVNAVASECANTVVVIHNAGVRMVEGFADNENVTGIVFAHLPGQDSGRALVSLLYGDDGANFNGKLPYTVGKKESDYPSFWHSEAVSPYTYFPQSDFTEGVLVDYRWFDAKNITPRYEFGFGLSYTTFNFSGLTVSLRSNSSNSSSLAAYPTGAIEQGGAVDLWDVIATVTATVTNTGSVSGAEVAQLYLGIPGGPAKQLRGFDKVLIAPGQSTQVSFSLTRRDLSSWNVVAQKWELQSGSYNVFVGSSSRDLPLQSTLKITTA